MNDQPPTPPTGDDAIPEEDIALSRQTATTDVTEDAKEAMRMFEADEQKKSGAEGQLVEDRAFLQISVKGAQTPLVVVLQEEMVIGRRDPNGEMVPDLDMTIYGAYQLGISRRHAVIRLVDQRLNLFDLGSRNGTYLNGYKLSPHQPAPLHDGDEIRVGKITMTIQIKKGR